MHLWVVCSCAVVFVLADAQVSRRRQLEPKDAWRETPSDNLIDIDVETERNSVGWQEGSGNGVEATDDEDLMVSGSGSGENLPDRSEVDRPPTANAGRDVVLYLPDNTVTLCGNASVDDRAIVSYQWTKKTHLLSADMLGSRSVCTQLNNLQIGDYTFSLVVTDSGGNKATADVRVYVKPAVTTDPQTPCQQLRETSRHVYGTFVPRCTDDGDYYSLQCRGHQGTSLCWCADLDGREIPGTAKMPPSSPDCDTGTNLPPCVFMLVRQLRGGLGAVTPRCSLEGFFQPVQCSGALCYCVHTHTGVKIPNTEATSPLQPVCDGSRTSPDKGLHATPRVIPDQKATVTSTQKTTAPVTETTTKVNVDNAGGKVKPTKKAETVTKADVGQTPSSAAHIMTQPGILAAIIGGSVVLLLCAVLLAMFVVYRMRKKDEGSYALDETKKMPNYSYQRAPAKEFYA